MSSEPKPASYIVIQRGNRTLDDVAHGVCEEHAGTDNFVKQVLGKEPNYPSTKGPVWLLKQGRNRVEVKKTDPEKTSWKCEHCPSEGV